jgi:hypothetical protein
MDPMVKRSLEPNALSRGGCKGTAERVMGRPTLSIGVISGGCFCPALFAGIAPFRNRKVHAMPALARPRRNNCLIAAPRTLKMRCDLIRLNAPTFPEGSGLPPLETGSQLTVFKFRHIAAPTAGVSPTNQPPAEGLCAVVLIGVIIVEFVRGREACTRERSVME